MQQAAGQVIKIEQRYACNIYILYTDHSYDQVIAGNRVMFGQHSVENYAIMFKIRLRKTVLCLRSSSDHNDGYLETGY